jgi:hypothetical protein
MKKYQSTSTMPYSQIRDTLNNDRQYWIQTLVKIADPVISNLSKDQLKNSIRDGSHSFCTPDAHPWRRPGNRYRQSLSLTWRL